MVHILVHPSILSFSIWIVLCYGDAWAHPRISTCRQENTLDRWTVHLMQRLCCLFVCLFVCLF